MNYWKDFFQQNRSPSNFMKKKKGHINLAGEGHMLPLPPSNPDCPVNSILQNFSLSIFI